ncbi:MAG: hypothetical protein GYA17_16440, partial [Chloroflexi bacterium]|nr:hypothetical protein [Chloroflexota bacterium]
TIDLETQSFQASKHYGLISLIPGASNLFKLPVFGKLLQSVNAISGITGTVRADVSSDLHVGPNKDRTDLTVTRGTLDSDLNVTMDVPLNLGLVNLGVTGGGDGHLKMDVVPKPKVLDCWVKLLFEAHAGVAGFFGVPPANFNHEWNVAACNPVALGLDYPAVYTAYRPSPVGLYARSENWQAPVATRKTVAQAGLEETILVENAGMVAQPELALGPDGQVAFVWVDELAQKPRQQALEIAARIQTGGTWSEPVQISHDDALDFNPQAVFDRQGNLLVVWNTNSQVYAGEDVFFDEGFADHLEIAFALLDPASGEILNRGRLTEDGRLDYMPHLASGTDGAVWLAWQSSDHADLTGSREEPNLLLASEWNGKAWSPAVTISDDLQGTLFFQIAVDQDGKGMLVYDQDLDGDLNTGQDRELMLSQLNGRGWSKPERLTDNDRLDLAAQLAYDAGHQPVVAWVQGEQIVALQGDLQGQPQVWIDQAVGANFSQARLLTFPNHQSLLLWPQGSAQGTQIWMAISQPGGNAWEAPQPVFDTATQKNDLSVGSTAQGTVYMGLAQFPVESSSQELSDGSLIRVPQAAETGYLGVVELAPALEPLPEDAPVQPGSNFGLVWALAGAGLLLLVTLAALVVMRSRKGKPGG